MPLDTHVLSQSVRLGLLTSGTASMSAARRLSDTLATIFPDDPLRGDFALFGVPFQLFAAVDGIAVGIGQ